MIAVEDKWELDFLFLFVDYIKVGKNRNVDIYIKLDGALQCDSIHHWLDRLETKLIMDFRVTTGLHPHAIAHGIDGKTGNI